MTSRSAITVSLPSENPFGPDSTQEQSVDSPNDDTRDSVIKLPSFNPLAEGSGSRHGRRQPRIRSNDEDDQNPLGLANVNPFATGSTSRTRRPGASDGYNSRRGPVIELPSSNNPFGLQEFHRVGVVELPPKNPFARTEPGQKRFAPVGDYDEGHNGRRGRAIRLLTENPFARSEGRSHTPVEDED